MLGLGLELTGVMSNPLWNADEANAANGEYIVRRSVFYIYQSLS
jgi:hypothetical protein